jgi:rod shape-determining protein MreD
MLRAVVMFVVMFVNLILQSTAFNYIEIINVKPNTALLLIVAYALLRGDIEGAAFGFVSGLLQDLFFGRVIGLYAMLGMVTGFVCGKPFKDFYKENYLIPIFLTGIVCVSYEFLFYVTYFLFQGKVSIMTYFGRIILPETMYTLVVTMPVYRLIYNINKRLESHERYTRKLF